MHGRSLVQCVGGFFVAKVRMGSMEIRACTKGSNQTLTKHRQAWQALQGKTTTSV